MKKFLTLALTVLLAMCLFGCQKQGGGEGEPAGGGDEHYDVVFLADLGSIYDGGFNEHSFYGIRDYCEENGLKYTYLQPAGSDDASRTTIFEQAVNQMSADVLVAVGFLWDAALCQEIPNYPNVKVIFVDADDLYNIDYDYDGVDDSLPKQENLAMITFAEQDCGYMAGYAVVKDGYRNLAFMGGMAVPAVVRFGYGFVEGAEDAAEELGLAEGSIDMKYFYTGTFDASPDIVTRASEWYTNGTEIIFSCGGTIVNSVIQAAKDGENRKIVGVDTDEYFTRAADGAANEPLFVTSAMKELELTIYNAVKAAYAGGSDWAFYTNAGLQRLGAKEGASIIAPYRAENWKTFTEDDYKAVNEKAIAVHDTLPTEASGTNGAPLDGYKYVKVTYFEQ
ncbi:MAG: BMP family ABC transporter substrate-binding protein [Erysipelotrichaceae bacterium]|nr:BMP family ABC transporter substrate-binding protein [Erysipelotrichaceae bacterium]